LALGAIVYHEEKTIVWRWHKVWATSTSSEWDLPS